MSIRFEIQLRTVLRWLLGVLFLWAAVSKAANPTDFLASLYAYQLPLPTSVTQLVAIVLPWLELLCGLLLLANVWSESVLVCVLALLALFVAATGQAWFRGLDIACGCFPLKLLGLSPSGALNGFLESVGFAFFRNLFLAAAAGWLLKARLTEIREPFPTIAT